MPTHPRPNCDDRDSLLPGSSSKESSRDALPDVPPTPPDIPADVRSGLDTLYDELYGSGNRRCLVTRIKQPNPVIITHVVQRASKPHKLTLYEYCLGVKYDTFDVDSRSNLFYLRTDLQTSFDDKAWILLPDAATLSEVHRYVKSSIAYRTGDPAADHVEEFTIKWPLNHKTKYTFISLLPTGGQPLVRLGDDSNDEWNIHRHPYRDLPDLESHIAPPYVVINAGPKCKDLDLDAVASRTCGQPGTSRDSKELKWRLELLGDTWKLFENAREASRDLEEKQYEEDDMDKSPLTSRCITRSQAHSAHSGSYENHPCSPHTASRRSRDKPGGSRTHKQSPRVFKKRERKLGSSLTETEVSHLNKRQKMSDMTRNAMVMHWLESTCV